MNKVKIRTITSSLEINYEISEKDINYQLSKIINQLKLFDKNDFDIRTLRINVIFNQKISITSLPSLINKLLYLKSLFDLSSIRWFSLSLRGEQFESIDHIAEITKTLLTKINNIFIHLILEKSEKLLLYEYAKTIIEVSRVSKNGFDGSGLTLVVQLSRGAVCVDVLDFLNGETGIF